jgi:hypothetical protein
LMTSVSEGAITVDKQLLIEPKKVKWKKFFA